MLANRMLALMAGLCVYVALEYPETRAIFFALATVAATTAAAPE